ncbi:MAG: acyltransferase domain-containing protein, partial [Mycobacterium sp.]|nr:acyltransferase domain-containing protein [Mycobacterium sp.]
LIGVVHTAVALDDGLISDLSAERMEAVFRAKVHGALHLHELTRDMNLSMFVLFSSVSGLVGMPGQGNYAAANVTLDALAQWRRAQGRAGVSLAWGLWAQESGATAGLSGASRARFRRAGLLPLSTSQALRLFDQAIRTDVPAVAAIAVDPKGVVTKPPPMLRGVVRTALGVADNATAQVSGLAQRLAGLSHGDGERLVLDVVRQHAGVVLGHGAADEVDPARAFKDQGFESLTAVELRNRLATTTGLRLPPTLVFDHPAPTILARYLRTRLTGDAGAATTRTCTTTVASEPVAIVGVGCRFPGGVISAETLWALVAEGRDAVGRFPTDRGWDVEHLFDSDPEHLGTSYTQAGGFLDDAAGFDAAFFGISPREALAMDPQQRVLLELAWEALEHAGIDPTILRGSNTGVFAGVYSTGHDVQALGASNLAGHLVTGSATSVASGRVAYTLGLEGPAITIDTACSSSLVATHLACQALRRGECDLALAGGATVLSTPQLFIGFSRQRGLAHDGRCKAFSAAADGMGVGEGAGLVVLERLSDARQHRHPVLAVIAGSAVNQDGASNGLTAPNGQSQQRVIGQALADASLSTRDIDVVEAHGTGTALGDPIEAEALLATYGQGHSPARPLWLGSLKSNIARTQAAAGIAGVIKMAQAIRYGMLPKTLHADQPSPHVDWVAGTVQLLTKAQKWPNTHRPRRAGISSFGISGTNAHLILEQAPHKQATDEMPSAATQAESWSATGTGEAGVEPPTLVWPISARTQPALAAQAARLRERVIEDPDLDLTDLAYSLAVTRAHHPCRAAITHALADKATGGDVRKNLLEALRALAAGQHNRHLSSGLVPRGGPGKMVFVFPGQGAQYPGMGKHLYDRFPAFAHVFDEVCTALDTHLDVPLRDVMFSTQGSPPAQLLDQTAYAQPALFAFGAALHELFTWAGIVPDYLLGHSIGELTAAYLSGVLSLPDASTLVTTRGRLMQSCTANGVMIALQATEEETLPLLDGHQDTIAIAAVNSHTSIVLSGDPGSVEKIRDHFTAQGRKATQLRVSHAFHSAHMDAVLEQFHNTATQLAYSPPTVDILSNLTGQIADPDQLASPDYWTQHLRRTVRFADSVQTLLHHGAHLFLELSP